MITEEARIPDALGDAQPPVVLHESGVLGVPLRVGGRGLSLVDEEAGHPARGEFDLQHQSDGTAAHDQVGGCGFPSRRTPIERGMRKWEHNYRVAGRHYPISAIGTSFYPRNFRGRVPASVLRHNPERFNMPERTMPERSGVRPGIFRPSHLAAAG